MLVLGIETSCDETAAAVVRDGREIISSVIASQIATHKRFGGVVPELASREHLDKIVPIVEEAFARAQTTSEEIDGIAVTIGPGLIGSLLVGVSYAKAMAFALNKPLVGVNHIEGHIYSVCFENPPVVHPALALVVSGGHTNLFFVPEPGKYKVVARTRDDAAGEACNGALRDAASEAASRLGVPVYFPSPHLSTDNAAMIAATGAVKLKAGERAGWDLNADVMLRLQNIEVDDKELRKRVRYRV